MKFLTTAMISMWALSTVTTCLLPAAEPNAVAGRPVKLSAIAINIGGEHEAKLKLAIEHLEIAGKHQVDLACLPEEFSGYKAEPLDGPTSRAIGELAKKHSMYVVCPIRELAEDGKQYNTAVLLGRDGKIAGYYRKIYVFWDEGIHCSEQGVKTFDTDFGRIAILTCFDANFDEVWQQAERQGAEIICWPSAYGGGLPLNGFAMIHNYNIVAVGSGNMIDIFGRPITAESVAKDQYVATVDLDLTIVHKDFNQEKVNALVRDAAGGVEIISGIGQAENWFVLRAVKPGVRVRELCVKHELETLRQYRHNSRTEILQRIKAGEPIKLPRKLQKAELPPVSISPLKTATPQEVPTKDPPAPPGSDPKQAEKKFKLPEDLEIQQILAEPTISQPLHISFDERGRLWLVEYRQYPDPAGLKIISRDNYWRNIYDKVPPAPPHHFPGADRISIHEDTDGDGLYEQHKNFVEGLSLVTSLARGRGGVWVLNPPYLLFYPDANNDDVPDGDPVVHLAGFGIEDSHSVTNSLRFGPDGWLYAAQGSTVTANIRRVGLDPADKPGVQSQGQLLWRYHPETRRFEIFAEGGGNAFGLEIDAKGRMFSGHNGGDTRGFHYVQGAYLQKGFSKHGPLSNPYAFGYFPPLKHDRVPRFTHEFVIYEKGTLPERYHGRMFAVAPLLNSISMTEMRPRGSTFETKDLDFITSDDPWFRPVDITVGPDGSLYIADWCDRQTNHMRNHEGEIDKLTGRVYRLQAKNLKQPRRGDLRKNSTTDLISLLSDENIWVRQTTLRLLGDRRDPTAIAPLRALLDQQPGPPALEILWALYQSGGFDTPTALAALGHPDPFVRQWAVRLLGDERRVENQIAAELAKLAQREPHIEVRSQLACTAKRLPPPQALAIVRELAKHPDSDDPQIPLLIWWALEAHCAAAPDAVLTLFAEPEFSGQQLTRAHLLSRVMQRYASTGKRADMLWCAKLLEQTSKESVGQLMSGFEAAFRGRTPANLPNELATALRNTGQAGLALRVRLNEPAAITEALAVLQDRSTKSEVSEELLTILGEIRADRAVTLLVDVATDSARPKLQRAAFGALGNFNHELIATGLLKAYATMSPEIQPLGQNLLAGRVAWSKQLLAAIDAGTISAASLPVPIVKKLLLHRDSQIDATVEKIWGPTFAQATAQVKSERERLEKVLATGHGSPYDGKKIFTATCAKCHTLFSEGAQIGPDLTAYNREQVGNMIRSIVDPNAEIREGFETFAVTTTDGRALTGFLADQDAQVVVLRGFNGENTNIPRADIEEMRNIGTSLMPEGLLKHLDEKQVRDLFSYIRSTQPLNN